MSSGERSGRTRRAGAGARWWALLLAGLLHGIFMALALPPIGLWPIALVAIVPLIWAGCGASDRPKLGALLTGLGVLPFWVVHHLWLIDVSGPGMPVLCVYMAAFSSAFVWIIAQVRGSGWKIPMTVAAPIVWVMLEMLRGEVIFTGYGFFMLGHPLIDNATLSSPGVLFGAYGVSFLCAALGGTVADAAGWATVKRPVGGIGVAGVAMLWLALIVLGGRVQARPAQSPKTIRFGVVQTNLPQSNKMGWPVAERLKDMRRFMELTRQAAGQRPSPEVLLWPETMFPGEALNPDAVRRLREGSVGYPTTDERGQKASIPANVFHDELVKLQQELGIPMLIGCSATDGDIVQDLTQRQGPRASRRFNTVAIIAGGKVQNDRYDKVELTPFGEMIPHVQRWPKVQQAVLNLGAAGMEFDLSAGANVKLLRVPLGGSDKSEAQVVGRDADEFDGSLRVAAPICFEGTRAGLCRRLMMSSWHPANVLVNFSNDGWFGWWDAGRSVHLLASRWRCVELGLPMVRAVNTGVSAVIDSRGQIVSTRLLDRAGASFRVDGVLVQAVELDLEPRLTPFAVMGLTPAYAVAGLGVVFTAACWWQRRRRQSGLI